MTRAIRQAVERAGGLASLADLARRWRVSRQRVTALSREPGFPAPVVTVDGGRRALYSLAECDRWRAARPGPGRPRKDAA